MTIRRGDVRQCIALLAAALLCCAGGTPLAADPPQGATPANPPALTDAQLARVAQAREANASAVRLLAAGKTRQAIPLARLAVSIDRETLGGESLETATSLSNLAFMLARAGDRAAARAGYEEALAIRRQRAPKSALVTETIVDLGAVLKDMQEYAAARPYFAEAVSRRKEFDGPKHPRTAMALNNLGMLLYEMQDYAAAQPYLEQALAISLEALGPDDVRTAASLGNLGSALLHQDDFTAARPYLNRSLDTYRKLLGQNDPQTIEACESLANLEAQAGQFAAARRYSTAAAVSRAATVGPNHFTTIKDITDVAMASLGLGDAPAARRTLDEALRRSNATDGMTGLASAFVMTNFGYYYQQTGEVAAARKNFAAALAIDQRLLGPRHANTVGALLDLASAEESLGNYAASRVDCVAALEIRVRAERPFSPPQIHLRNKIAELSARLGDLASARRYYQEALDINRRRNGARHVDTAASLNNLGLLLKQNGDYAAARPYLDESLAIFDDALGPLNPTCLAARNNRSLLSAAAGDGSAALAGFDRVRRDSRRLLATLAPGLRPRDEFMLLERSEGENLHAALSLALARRADGQAHNLSAAWLLNGKGVANEVFAVPARLARAARDPATAGVARELAEVYRQAAALILAAGAADSRDIRRMRIDELEARAKALAANLATASDQPARLDPWVELADVRRAMAKDSVLVDIARFQTRAFQAKGQESPWGSARYAAWIIPPAGRGDVQIVDLGEAWAIDNAVYAARRALQPAAGDGGAASQSQTGSSALRALARLVWRPLVAGLGDAREVIVSPDAALWLVPWGALPADDSSRATNQYVIERWRIRCVTSGRDLASGAGRLLTDGAAITAGRASCVFSAPDYDAPLPKNRGDDSQITESAIGRTSGWIGLAQPMPDAAARGDAIQSLLERRGAVKSAERAEPAMYSGAAASLPALKRIERPAALVLATQAFFLPPQEIRANDLLAAMTSRPINAAILDRDGKAIENPLLRCGMLLAGCNNRVDANDARLDAGLASALDIAGLDLRGTELVVLPTCETFASGSHAGEGIAALGQAFQMAGARDVLYSLWTPPARQSSQLLGDFFDNLADGQSKADALRGAQLRMIEAQRQAGAAADAFDWAAWTLVGR